MSEELNPRIKREFDALIYSVIDSDKLAEAVIKRLHERRRKLVFKTIIGLLATTLFVLAGIWLVNNSTSNEPTVITYKSQTTEGGEGLISLPFTQYIAIDGSDPAKSTFDFKVRLKAGQSVLFWTHFPMPSSGVEGKMIASIQMPDGSFKDFQTYEIGSFTNRQQVRTYGDGIYRYRLKITDAAVKGNIEVSIVLIGAS